MLNDAMQWDIAECVAHFCAKPVPYSVSPMFTVYKDQGIDMIKVGMQINFPDPELFYFAAFKDLKSAYAFWDELCGYVNWLWDNNDIWD